MGVPCCLTLRRRCLHARPQAEDAALEHAQATLEDELHRVRQEEQRLKAELRAAEAAPS